jgi:YjbE family integral membrane protein
MSKGSVLMDGITTKFFSDLLAIIIIDLVLAGDNAILIGMAARNLPKSQQRRVIFLGTLGAIIVRAFATLVVVWLLKIPGLLVGGGLLLIWIAYGLLTEKNEHTQVEAGQSMWAAIRTIIVADAVMGLDNVLAVAGAASGSFMLVITGLVISVPVVVWGSTIVLKFIERYPVIMYVGAGVLALTAGKMITSEPFLHPFFSVTPGIKWLVIGLIIGGVLFVGGKRRQTEN